MKISKFPLSIILIGIAYLVLRFGIHPPIPSSLLYLYLAITLFAVTLFISVSNKSLADFYAPIKSVIVEPEKRLMKIIIFTLLPVVITALTYLGASKETIPPAELRSIHPAPPTEITFRGNRLNLTGLTNPLRGDTANYNNYVEEGAVIYFKNCFFCHGDNLDGMGHFAAALNPPPANFVDKGTIAQLQESYVFWRISKGGRGLPNEGKPWDTAMPVWEDILSEDDIWKVIIYIYDAAGVEPRTWEEDDEEDDKDVNHNGSGSGNESVADRHNAAVNNDVDGEHGNKTTALTDEGGRAIYMKKCRYCHGLDGKGGGPAADLLSPRPRDLTKARYKLKSTPGGKLPTDQDIFDVITNGIPTTSMPAWHSLSNDEKWMLVKYLKTLSKRFKRAEERGAPAPITIPGAVTPSADSIAAGKALFKKLECPRCHGENGMGDGENALTLKDDWGHPIKPANLGNYWRFKGGFTARDIYKTITTGRAGTPMPSFIDSATDEERWHLANFVRSIGPDDIPKKATLIKPLFTSGDLPVSADDPVWDSLPADRVDLFGQILATPKLYTPSIDAIYIKSLFNGKEIAFLLEWDDISNTSGGGDIFADGVAIQFPNKIGETNNAERPHFLMGGGTQPVNLWNWNNDTGFGEANAWGIDKLIKQDDTEGLDISGDMAYSDGRYRVSFNRPLSTSDEDRDIQFETNRFIPVAFSVYNGNNGETASKASISTWHTLALEKGETVSNVIYAVIAGLFAATLEGILLWRIKTD